jgi:hypothetical protein
MAAAMHPTPDYQEALNEVRMRLAATGEDQPG